MTCKQLKWGKRLAEYQLHVINVKCETVSSIIAEFYLAQILRFHSCSLWKIEAESCDSTVFSNICMFSIFDVCGY